MIEAHPPASIPEISPHEARMRALADQAGVFCRFDTMLLLMCREYGFGEVFTHTTERFRAVAAEMREAGYDMGEWVL